MTFHHTVSKILKIVVIKISDYILNAIECKKITILVLLDLSKAFDRINHYLLLGKRERIDASPSAIRWFKSYLSADNKLYVLALLSPVSCLPIMVSRKDQS